MDVSPYTELRRTRKRTHEDSSPVSDPLELARQAAALTAEIGVTMPANETNRNQATALTMGARTAASYAGLLEVGYTFDGSAEGTQFVDVKAKKDGRTIRFFPKTSIAGGNALKAWPDKVEFVRDGTNGHGYTTAIAVGGTSWRPCNEWEQKKSCRLGIRCLRAAMHRDEVLPPMNVHAAASAPATESNAQAGPSSQEGVAMQCHQFMSGYCKKGDKCIFLHGPMPVAGPKEARREDTCDEK